MDWEALFSFLGAGGGLVVLLRWLSELPSLRLKVRKEKAEADRDIHEQYLTRIKELNKHVLELAEQVEAFGACLAKIVNCPLYGNCPARHVVQEYKRKYYYVNAGQTRLQKGGQRLARDDPRKPGDIGDTARQPP